MRRVTWAFIIGILLIISFVAAAFFYMILAKPKFDKPEFDVSSQAGEVIINENLISYVLAEIGAYQLHSPPLSSEKPSVEIDIGERNFFSEVENGKVITRMSQISTPDLVIKTSESEIENAVKSGSIKEAIKNSVASGKTLIELKAGYTTLFFKGYLTIYKELTGKSFTGSVVKVFGQG